MKAKNWFVTLISLTLLPLTVSAGESTDSYCVASGLGLDEIPISGVVGTSGAIYSGKVGYDGDYPCFIMDQTYVYATTTSPGTAKTVSITWADDEEFYNTVSESTIYVYGRHSAFDGSETKGDLDAAGVTCIGSIVYAGVFGTSALDVSAGSYEYIAIVGGATQSGVQCVSVTWTVEDVVTYTLTSSVTGKGKVSFSPASSVAEGTTVKVQFKGSGTELHSFTIKNGASVIEATDLDEDEYTASYSTTFTMPAGNVNVTAVFDATPSRVANPISVNGSFATYETTIQSGAEEAITVATTYSAGTSPAYNKTLKSVTSSNTEVVQVVSNTYDYASGSGVLTLEGKATGTATVTITTYQTNGTQSSKRIINVTVEPREVMLVTELDGRYFALTNQSDGSYLHALELLYEDGIYYYDPTATYDVDDITWEMTTLQGLLEPYYYIQNPSNGNYLYNEGSEALGVVSASCRWFKDASSRLYSTGSVGIVYNGISFLGTSNTKWSSESTFSKSVYEVPIAEIEAAKQYSTSNSSADTYDSRSLTAGKMGTICVPFNVPVSFVNGAELYSIESKLVSGDNLTGLTLAEVTDKLEAGHSYMFMATSTSIDMYYGVVSATTANTATNDGFVGCLPSDGSYVSGVSGVTPRKDGYYGIKDNQLHYVASGTPKANQYRALINAAELSDGTPAPGRRVMYVANDTNSENGENTTTSLEDLLNNATLINWNEPVYNMLGRQVGKGTTGVLLQNGQKFLVQ